MPLTTAKAVSPPARAESKTIKIPFFICATILSIKTRAEISKNMPEKIYGFFPESEKFTYIC
jgi:hypothetical protein